MLRYLSMSPDPNCFADCMQQHCSCSSSESERYTSTAIAMPRQGCMHVHACVFGSIYGLAVSSSAASDPYGDIHPVRSTVSDRVRGRSLTASDRRTVMYSDCITSLIAPVQYTYRCFVAPWCHDIDTMISTRSAELDIQLISNRFLFFRSRFPSVLPSLVSDFYLFSL